MVFVMVSQVIIPMLQKVIRNVTISIDVPYLRYYEKHCSFKDYQLYKAEEEIVKIFFVRGSRQNTS